MPFTARLEVSGGEQREVDLDIGLIGKMRYGTLLTTYVRIRLGRDRLAKIEQLSSMRL